MSKNISVFLLLVANFCFAQNEFSSKIKNDCADMNKAMKTKDYKKILDYTYPKIIEMAGGKEQILEVIEASFKVFDEQGYVFEDMIIGEPQSIYIAGNELHCLVLKEIILKTPKGTLKSSSYLLAISKNKGEKWYFLEAKMLNEDNRKVIFPSFNSALVIPKTSAPTLIN